MKFRTLSLTAALLAGSMSLAVAQAGGDAGAGGTRNGGAAPAQNNQGGSTDPKGAAPMAAPTGNSNMSSGSQSGQMGDCPAGQARTAAADGSKGPCKATN